MNEAQRQLIEDFILSALSALMLARNSLDDPRQVYLRLEQARKDIESAIEVGEQEPEAEVAA